MRAKDNLRHEVIVQHDEHDCLVSMTVSPTARKIDPQLPSHWQARLIELQLGGRKRRFITSLTDASRYPAKELAKLYMQRWEIELGFRSIKHSLQSSQWTLRSKQQTAAAGATGAVGRTDCIHVVTQTDAPDGCTREGGAIGYGLSRCEYGHH
jgi:hypothetical protein